MNRPNLFLNLSSQNMIFKCKFLVNINKRGQMKMQDNLHRLKEGKERFVVDKLEGKLQDNLRNE